MMMRVLLSALGILLLIGTGCASIAPSPPLGERSSSSETSSPFAQFAWPEDNRIRSAGRIRDLALQHEGGIDAEAGRKRLQTHFVAILELLREQEDESLSAAVERWTNANHKALSPAEKADLRERLRLERRHQLHVLADYAERGRFPLNSDVGGPTRPIFVDAHDTACAVGYLMRADGYHEAVEAIRQNDLFVHVPDIQEGTLVAWVLESGLLQEEAALIQPGYAPPPANHVGGVDLGALAAPGVFVETGGLRIETFSGRSSTSNLPSGVTLEILELFAPNLTPQEALDLLGLGGTYSETVFGPADWADITLHSGVEYSSPNGGEILSVFETSPVPSPWLFWNAGAAGGFLNEGASPGYDSDFELSFDVSAVEAGYGIDAAIFSIGGAFWNGAPTNGQDLQMDVMIQSVGGDVLANYSDLGGSASHSGDPQLGTNFFSNNNFEAQERVRVTVRGSQSFADQPLVWSQFRQDFQLVLIPEPSVGLLLAFGLAGLSAGRRES